MIKMRGADMVATGLALIPRSGKGYTYVMADGYETWVFSLPHGHGYLWCTTTGYGIWAPTLNSLVLTFIEKRFSRLPRRLHANNKDKEETTKQLLSIGIRMLMSRIKSGEYMFLLADAAEIEDLMGVKLW